MDQPSLAQRPRRRHRRSAAAALRHSHGHHPVPPLNVITLTGWLAAGLTVAGALAWAALRITTHRHPPTRRPEPTFHTADRATWCMPPLVLLQPVTWKPGTKLGMLALRCYLLAGALLLVIKAIQLSNH